MGTLVGSFDHNTQGRADVVVQSILLFLVYVSVILRLWSRRLVRIPLEVNDWLILFATFLMTGRVAAEFTAIFLCGLGLHVDEVMRLGGPNVFVRFKKISYTEDLLWVTIVTIIKLSILDFYTRIFRVSSFVRVAYAAMGLCAAFWIAAFFATAFFCTPPQKSWYSEIPGRCGDSHEFYTGYAVTDLIIDVIVISLPLPVLWKLQLPLGRKVALIAIFALGFLVIFITAIRIKFMNELDNLDATYSYAKLAIFSSLVPHLGIINACLPIMRPAFRSLFGSGVLDTRKSAPSGYSSQPNGHIRKRTTVTRSYSPQFERIHEPDIPLVAVTCSGKK